MLSLQAQMLLLLAIGIFLTKKNIITEQGRACLTDLLLTSIYLIPQRIVMWSMGVSYFMRDDAAASPGGRTHHRAVLRKTLTHPCILAVFVGMALMLTQCQLPAFLGKALQCTSNCNMTMSMLLIGAIIGSCDLHPLLDRDAILYCVIRLLLMPLVE